MYTKFITEANMFIAVYGRISSWLLLYNPMDVLANGSLDVTSESSR